MKVQRSKDVTEIEFLISGSSWSSWEMARSIQHSVTCAVTVVHFFVLKKFTDGAQSERFPRKLSRSSEGIFLAALGSRRMYSIPGCRSSTCYLWSGQPANGRMLPSCCAQFVVPSTGYTWEGSWWTQIIKGFADHAQGFRFILGIRELLKSIKRCNDQSFLFHVCSIESNSDLWSLPEIVMISCETY